VLSAAAAVLVAVGLGTGWWRVLPVLSPSMRPTFEAGAVVIAVRAPSSSVRAGDILVYEAPVEDRRVVAHRVVRVVEAGAHPVVQTRGDANNAADPWMARLQDASVWKVRADVPKLGYALVYLRQPRVRYALLLVVVGFALVASLREVWGGQRRAGRATAAGGPRVARRRRRAHPAGVGDVAVVAERRAPDGLGRDAGAADRDGGLRPAPADPGAGHLDGDPVELRRRL
jgi:signal peptidase I